LTHGTGGASGGMFVFKYFTQRRERQELGANIFLEISLASFFE